MRRGSIPKPCYWCDRNGQRVRSLFVNGHGWTDVCDDCVGVPQTVPAALAARAVPR